MAVGIPLGPYRLVRRLATGGMAEIFLARQEGPDGFARELVVKRILPHLAADPEFTRMFRDEAKLAALLSHPNAVHVYDFGAVPDEGGVTLYLAMELVRGVDLRALILRALTEAKRTGRAGAIPPHHAAKICSFVCEALAHAHSVRIDGRPAGIVHRDVTPSNVLVSFDGAVKLADFGIAKAASTGPSDRTEHGVVKGKHTYLSPEQARGEALDARSDLFNVGILLFESVLGEALFPPSDHRLARRYSASGQLPRVERFERLPPALAKIALKALSPDREDRHPDALALRSELEAYLRSSSEPSDTVEIGRFVRQMCAEELSEDALGPRAAGTVASKRQPGTAPLTGAVASPPASRGELLQHLQRKSARPVPAGTAPIEPTGLAVAPPAQRAAASSPSVSGTQPLPQDGGTTDPTLTSIGLPGASPAEATDLAVDGREVFTATGAAELDLHASALVPAPPTGLDRPSGRPSAAVPPAASTTPIVRRSRPRWPWAVLALAIVGVASIGALALVMSGDDETTRVALPRTGSVSVSSEPPGARLFVDGVEHGVTPALVAAIMPGRAVHLELRATTGEVLDATEITLGEGETRTIALRGTPPTGLVRVSSEPLGASVSLDGTSLGVTPLEREVPLGEHRLRVELAGFAPEEDEVRVEHGGDRASLSFSLRPVGAAPRRDPVSGSHEPREPTGPRETGPRETGGDESRRAPPPSGTGTLRATTTPWSNVFDGTRPLGMTPVQVQLSVGRHTLTFRAEDRPPRTEVVEIRAGEITRVRLVL
ncbi:MAG: PEGA domain-containing protein [Sandaracinaceae bacterium]|nr:PEGA domain-containing protein [Sandaracinaceae bacterium]